MNNDDRLNLKRLVSESECDDNTENIRKLKHSELIRKDSKIIQIVKTLHSSDGQLVEQCRNRCPFLYNNYTDLFNRLVKDELDINILNRLLDVLKRIEDGLVDQHEGSVAVGTILKEMYVDSALKHSNNIADTSTPAVYSESKAISWKQYKIMNNEL
jgi:hypothetical protein